MVDIGSINARLAQPRLVALSAAAALSNLGKALAEEFAGRGLRVNTVSPVPCGPTSGAPRAAPGTCSPGGPASRGGRRHPAPPMLGVSTGRFAEPDEIAALVAFLASGRVPNMSGSDLVVDGGMLKAV